MLRLLNVTSGYGGMVICKNISIHIKKGETISIIGANGAGKTTLLRTISGIIQCKNGKISFGGEDITNKSPHEIVKSGLIQVAGMEESIFAPLTILENLMVSLYPFKRELSQSIQRERMEYIYSIFPVLKERNKQKAGTLSGGERQMLSIAKALICQPKFLMLDEPSLGLAPIIVNELFEIIKEIKQQHELTLLIVEQNVRIALGNSDRAYVLEVGRIAMEGTSSKLLEDQRVRDIYLGAG